MAFDLSPAQFLINSRKANRLNQEKIDQMDFANFGDPTLFSTAKRKSRGIEDTTSGFEDLSTSGLGTNDATNAALGIKAEELANAADNIGLMAELEVKKYGAEKMADEQRRRDAYMRAQCQQAKRKSKWGSIGAIIGGVVSGNYGMAIAGGANLLGGSGGC